MLLFCSGKSNFAFHCIVVFISFRNSEIKMWQISLLFSAVPGEELVGFRELILSTVFSET